MLRSSRTIVSLIRSLVLGTATTTGVLLVASTMVGCKDESQPEFWVDKLSDQAWRGRAVKRLEQFYDDAVTKNQGVQELVDKTVDPLTKTYVDGYDSLDGKTRVALIKLLAAFKDKRTEPALKKAFLEFAKAPATSKDDQDLKWAAIATADLALPTLADPLLQAYLKLRASSMLGGVAYRDVNDAMRAIPDKSWAGPLIKQLDPVMVPPSSKDKGSVDAYRDQQFWQVCAAEILGKIADPSAVEPLIKVMLDPTKADVQNTAAMSLVKLGKPAADAAVKLLRGQNDALSTFAVRRIKEVSGNDPKGKPYVATAAVIVGTIGRPDTIPPMIEALKAETDDSNKAVIARELAKIPATAESKAAFKAAYESISLDAEIPPGGSALETLTESAGMFFDPTFVDWLLDRATKLKGSDDDKKALQAAITVTAMKLAKPDQLAKVKAAVDKYGTKVEKDAFALVDSQIKACADKAGCYVTEMQKPANQERATQFAAVKAGYMVGIYGNEQTRDQIVSGLDSIQNASVRYVASQVIDHLSPNGSKDVAKKLMAIIERNAKSMDKDKAAGDPPLKTVAYRLEARGG